MTTNLPTILYIAAILFFSAQLIFLSTWYSFLPEYDSLLHSILSKIEIIFLWHDSSAKGDLLVPLIVFSSIVALTLLLLIAILIYFYFQRKFLTWSLYIFRFVIEMVPLVSITPLGYSLGSAVFCILTEKVTGNYITAICLFVLYFCCMIIFLYITTSVFHRTPYLSKSLLTTWNGDYLFLSILVPALLELHPFYLTYITHSLW